MTKKKSQQSDFDIDIMLEGIEARLTKARHEIREVSSNCPNLHTLVQKVEAATTEIKALLKKKEELLK